jgi:hypothetical protein
MKISRITPLQEIADGKIRSHADVPLFDSTKSMSHVASPEVYLQFVKRLGQRVVV